MNRKIVFLAYLQFEAHLTVYSTKLMRITEKIQVPHYADQLRETKDKKLFTQLIFAPSSTAL